MMVGIPTEPTVSNWSARIFYTFIYFYVDW